MTTTAPPADPRSAATPKKSVDLVKKYWWAAAIAVPILVAVIGIVPDLLGGSSGNTYITNSRIGGDLYLTTNVQLNDPAQQAQFDQALGFAHNGQYAQAKALFERVAAASKTSGVLNNLGVVNAALGDDAAAQSNMAQALTIDPTNEAAKVNLSLIAKAVAVQTANNTILTAAPAQLRTAVESVVGPMNDDFYTFTAPATRDVIEIRVDNASTTLMPDLYVFDTERVQLGRQYRTTPGANVSIELAAEAGAKYFVRVAGISETAGAYALSITPQQAFDRYEANETLLAARGIEPGQDIEANVMDGHDSDVYRVAVKPGPVQVTMTNRSATLQPELSLFDDTRNRVAHDYRSTAGSHVSIMGTATVAGTWYIQINALSASSAGAYTLKVSQ